MGVRSWFGASLSTIALTARHSPEALLCCHCFRAAHSHCPSLLLLPKTNKCPPSRDGERASGIAHFFVGEVLPCWPGAYSDAPGGLGSSFFCIRCPGADFFASPG